MNSDQRPIGYFVHHQGRGHAKRCLAIARHLDRPVVAFCARPELLDEAPANVEVVALPDSHARPSRTDALHRLGRCSAMDCAPVGVSEIRRGMGLIASWMARADPGLLVADVSAEVALLGRLCSVPVVKIRMHGDRSDAAHEAAYTASAGLLAPYDERLEQSDWPEHLRGNTFYAGGLVAGVPSQTREEARAHLGLSGDEHVVVVIAGGGGLGIPYAAVTMGARALPTTRWVIVGPTLRKGHETDFSNIDCVGWTDEPHRYLAAADTVVGTAGDTLVHEVAAVGRPFVCIPEWCYYDEQRSKARALEDLGAAVCVDRWPASFAAWRRAMDQAAEVDLDVQRSLVDGKAAIRAAGYLDSLCTRLWESDRGAANAPAVAVSQS